MTTVSHAVDPSGLMMAVAPNVGAQISSIKDLPEKYEGYLMKKKKWPLKGWHRRYFFLDKGFLKYAKTPHRLSKNKLHGVMDMGMTVMSTKKNALTIDLDAEDIIFHLKLKSASLYQLWVSKLRVHRDFRQLEMKKDSTVTHSTVASSEVQSPVTPLSSEDHSLKDTGREFETCNQGLHEARNEIVLLGKMVSELQMTTSSVISSILSLPPQSPSLSKKDKETRKAKKMSKKAHKSNASLASSGTDQRFSAEISANSTPSFLSTDVFKVPASLDSMHNLSRSNPDLSLVSTPNSTTSLNIEDNWNKQRGSISKSVQSTPTRNNPPRTATFSESSSSLVSSPIASALSDLSEKQKVFFLKASNVQKSLSTIVEHIKILDDSYQKKTKVLVMKNTLSQLRNENDELKARLKKIHNDSSLSEPFLATPQTVLKRRITNKSVMSQFLSESELSITESMSDLFYDAEEYLISDEESTSEEESETCEDEASSGAELSDGSETTSTQSLPYEIEEISGPGPVSETTGRRTKLPCYRPDTDVSLWNILKKNIGKDLSKVAMPVTLNEPLNALQLLCEELEYSSLLDKADRCDDPYEQMVYVAAFAVSAYGGTKTRAAQKPFNPILGETYECVREDKSFRFVSEQVSHHPPVSVCHCVGDSFEFWQDLRFKNKFWGKSIEVFPVGSVHVRLKKQEREYHWKKVTSCIHNIMTGTRWIEHYGDMVITCGDKTCKVTFSKSGYWSTKNGEISGTVMDESGEAKYKLHGKWFEGIYCDIAGKTRTIWRPHAMPNEFERQYGFTRFAIELNELTPDLVEVLPRTDTRFRPDQRCLENGDISGAEREKVRVEQLQREHKKQRDAKGVDHQPLFFTKINGRSDDEGWLFKGDYWKLRQDPGFKNFDKLPCLW